MNLDVENIMSAVTSHAMASGWFDRVNQHEPKSAPGHGMSCAVWVDRLEMIRGSGLASSSARLVFNVRLYTTMIQEPQDAIDPNLLRAADALFSAYAEDFDLGGEARTIDLLGIAGEPVFAQAGYINQDNRIYRVFTITLPIIVNDVWDQG